MHAEVPLRPTPRRRRHMHHIRREPQQPPQVSGRVVASDSPPRSRLIRFSRKNSCPTPRVPSQPPMPHRVDALMKRNEAASIRFSDDQLPGITDSAQLSCRHHAVLIRSHPSQRRWRSSFVPHTTYKGRTPPRFAPLGGTQTLRSSVRFVGLGLGAGRQPLRPGTGLPYLTNSQLYGSGSKLSVRARPSGMPVPLVSRI